MKVVILLTLAAVPFIYVAVAGLAGLKSGWTRTFEEAQRSRRLLLEARQAQWERIEAAKRRNAALIDEMTARLAERD